MFDHRMGKQKEKSMALHSRAPPQWLRKSQTRQGGYVFTLMVATRMRSDKSILRNHSEVIEMGEDKTAELCES